MSLKYYAVFCPQGTFQLISDTSGQDEKPWRKQWLGGKKLSKVLVFSWTIEKTVGI